MESEIRRVSEKVFGGNRPRHQGNKRNQQGAEFSLDDTREPTAPAQREHGHDDGRRTLSGRQIRGEREIGGRLDVTA